MNVQREHINSTQRPPPSFAQRYKIPLFYVLAFSLSWLVWGSEIAQQRRLLTFSLPDLLAYFGLTIAAFLVASLAEGRIGIRDLFSRMVRWRVGLQWYAVVIFLPIALLLVAAGVYSLFGGSVPIGRLNSLEFALGYFVLAIPFMLLTEETAWRGFALPRLQVKYRALTASLIVGVLWGVWHTPLFLIQGTTQSTYPYVGFVFMTVAQSVLTAWVFNNTGGSVLLATIFHAATNAAWSYIGIGVGDVPGFWVVVAVMCVAAVVVVALEGPDRLSRRERVDQPPVAPQERQAQQIERAA